MKISMYCDDIRNLTNKLEQNANPIEWIRLATEIVKTCRDIAEVATEEALKKEAQPELNI